MGIGGTDKVMRYFGFVSSATGAERARLASAGITNANFILLVFLPDVSEAQKFGIE